MPLGGAQDAGGAITNLALEALSSALSGMLAEMDADAEVRRRREGLSRVLRKLQALLDESEREFDALTSGEPSEKRLAELERLRVDVAGSAKEYLDEQEAYSEYVREQLRKIEEARAAATMPEKSSKAPRDEARIQQMSEDLMRDLRLQRVDAAIKELMDFLSDAEFFAANASTGRKRKLRALGNAIEKALEK
jgi:hypothetical protein